MAETVGHPVTVLYNAINQGYGGNQKLGYAYALRHGFDFVVLLHGDGQYAPESIPDLLAPLINSSADAVFGSRMLVPGAARKGGMPLYKFAGNKILTWFQNWLLVVHLSEFHSGFRAYRVSSLGQIPFEYNSNVFHFDTEIIIQLLLGDFRVTEVQLDFSKLEAFADVAACMRRSGPVAVFRPQQPGFRATWATSNTAELADELAPKAGVVPTGLIVHGDDVYMAFQPASSVIAGRSISVVEATYGANCAALRGNATALVKNDCDGSTTCVFRVEVLEIGDPSPGCSKDFTVAWTCGRDGTRRQTAIGAEAGFGSAALLTCGP